MRFAERIAPHEEAFLALEFAASEPYARFVYAEEAVAREVARGLLARGVAEFAEPRGRLVVSDGGVPLGMIAWLNKKELANARFQVLRALDQLGVLAGDAAAAERMKLAGQLMWKPGPGDVYLSRIAVDPQARGRGVAGFMLDRLEQEARVQGALRIVLEVSPVHSDAMRLYAKRGFEKLGEHAITHSASARTLAYVHLAKVLA